MADKTPAEAFNEALENFANEIGRLSKALGARTRLHIAAREYYDALHRLSMVEEGEPSYEFAERLARQKQEALNLRALEMVGIERGEHDDSDIT